MSPTTDVPRDPQHPAMVAMDAVFATAHSLIDDIERITAQRDELLAAVKACKTRIDEIGMPRFMWQETLFVINRAIEKAEGK